MKPNISMGYAVANPSYWIDTDDGKDLGVIKLKITVGWVEG
jgi:hypothetical protein